LRRPKTRRPAEAGSQNAVAAKILLEAPPEVAPKAVEAPAVLMVSVSVAVPPDPGNATDDALKLQEKYLGSVPQEKLTGAVRPPWDVIVNVTVPELPNGIARLLGLMLAVNPGLTIVSVKGAEVLPAKFAFPSYVAWIVAVPVALKDVVSVATPFANVPVPIDAVPL
jgi:hypothetical protein